MRALGDLRRGRERGHVLEHRVGFHAHDARAVGRDAAPDSRILARLANLGGPRCCKRTGFVALQEAAAYTAELRGIEMEMPERITCRYFHRNRECLRAGCPFFGR